MRAVAALTTGNIFSIERHALHDGDGIRTIVYFKGCPLRCLWCSNPESQDVQDYLAVFWNRCIYCDKCVEVCPQKAFRRTETGLEHDRGRCAADGHCVEVCPADALRLWGRRMAVEEVLAEVSKDLPFYLASGGGVTLSGGETMMQAPFATRLLEACREQGIHTALETCGHARWTAFQAIVPHLDQLMYDIKHMDSSRHVQLTGVPHRLILDNAGRLAGRGVAMTIRQTVIPGQNDSKENIHQLAEFVKGLAGRPPIELLPYHGYGAPKYEQLDRGYSLTELEPPTQEQLQRLRDLVRGHGLRCEII